MTCRDVEPRLSQFVDADLTADERAAVSRHLEGCAACRALVDDLTRVRDAARGLGPIPPPDHIWLEIAGQIRLGDRPTPAAVPAPSPARRSAAWQWIGLAAALVVITLGVFLVMRLETPKSGAATPAGNGQATGSVETVAQELGLALQHYDKAIAELEVLAKSNDGTIDPATAATLQKNLGVIDRAIAESRAALASDPQSQPAFDSLIDALRQKVGVLQTTVALMNEIRRGNQEGAARVVAGAGKS
ncbi:MAG: zf-HC2 domain-containing protein [Vicinamibacterales bacterium]